MKRFIDTLHQGVINHLTLEQREALFVISGYEARYYEGNEAIWGSWKDDLLELSSIYQSDTFRVRTLDIYEDIEIELYYFHNNVMERTKIDIFYPAPISAPLPKVSLSC